MSDALKIVQKFFPDVTSVGDAKDSITIEVTKEDSKSKGRRDHKHCAFAVACQRLTKASGVIVAIKTAYLIFGDQAFRYRVPEAVSREIVSFDRDAEFATGTYKLTKMPPWNRLGANAGGGMKPPKKKQGKNKVKHITTGIRANLNEEI
jgi:hypothetical protein